MWSFSFPFLVCQVQDVLLIWKLAIPLVTSKSNQQLSVKLPFSFSRQVDFEKNKIIMRQTPRSFQQPVLVVAVLTASILLLFAKRMDFILQQVSAQGMGQYSVSTFAGFRHIDGLNQNFHTDGVSATYAPLSSEIYVTFASNGDLYLVDQNLNRVLKVDANSGVLTTVAGINSANFNGDGMKGSRTALAYPRGVAVLPNGDVLIGDTNSHRVSFHLDNFQETNDILCPHHFTSSC